MMWREKKGFRKFLVFVLVITICTGCGTRSSVDSAENASGTAVQSGGGAAQGKADALHIPTDSITYLRYFNARCLYTTDGKSVISQYLLDGTDKKTYQTGGDIGDIWVTEDWLYYSTVSMYSEERSGAVCRIPMTEKGERETLSTEQKEELFQVEDWYDFLDITEEYIAYLSYDDIYRYDLKNGKTKKISKGIRFSEESDSLQQYMVKDAYLNPLVKNGVTFCYDKDSKLFRLDLKKGNYKKAAEEITKNGLATRICASGDTMYFGTARREKGSVVQYNMETDTSKKVLSGKDIAKLLQKEEPWDCTENDADWLVYPSFVYGDRLYVSVELCWEDICDDEIHHFADFVISCKAEDGSDLRYEKEISSCMHTGIEKELTLEQPQSFYDETGYVRCCMGDYVVVTTTAYEETDEFAWIFYNLKTGTQHKVERGDREQYYMYFIGEVPEKTLEGEQE